MLDALLIDETGDTPKVILDPANNKFELSGRSLPENSVEFYRQIFDWFEKYEQNPNELTNLEINMFYFNTSSSKMILDLLFRMEKMKENGKHVQVTWYVDEDDEDMIEMGEEFGDIVDVPMKIEINEE